MLPEALTNAIINEQHLVLFMKDIRTGSLLGFWVLYYHVWTFGGWRTKPSDWVLRTVPEFCQIFIIKHVSSLSRTFVLPLS